MNDESSIYYVLGCFDFTIGKFKAFIPYTIDSSVLCKIAVK